MAVITDLFSFFSSNAISSLLILGGVIAIFVFFAVKLHKPSDPFKDEWRKEKKQHHLEHDEEHETHEEEAEIERIEESEAKVEEMAHNVEEQAGVLTRHIGMLRTEVGKHPPEQLRVVLSKEQKESWVALLEQSNGLLEDLAVNLEIEEDVLKKDYRNYQDFLEKVEKEKGLLRNQEKIISNELRVVRRNKDDKDRDKKLAQLEKKQEIIRQLLQNNNSLQEKVSNMTQFLVQFGKGAESNAKLVKELHNGYLKFKSLEALKGVLEQVQNDLYQLAVRERTKFRTERHKQHLSEITAILQIKEKLHAELQAIGQKYKKQLATEEIEEKKMAA